MKSRILLVVLVIITSSLIGCRGKKPELKPAYDNPLLPGQLALRKITNPDEIPDFTLACITISRLRESVDNSLNYLAKPSSKTFFPSGQITHEMAVQSLQAFAQLLDSGLTGAELNNAIREKFDVYMSVGCDNNGTVLFTGYYTPIFDGSLTPTDKFKYPLYKQPADLVKDDKGNIQGRKLSDGSIVPYPSRAVIEAAQMLKGNELVWLGDAFEAYIANVQGSAKIRTSDGKLVGIGYAANNGQLYQSIGMQMVNDGTLTRDQLSLSAMIDFFKTHPDLVSTYTNINPRYVFFRLEEGDPKGSLNEPVISLRSIATDKTIFPRACLTFFSTNLPLDIGGQITIQPYTGFALDQDTGGAIRAAGRCDVYMGQGDNAGKLAGQTYQEGKLYYLFLKDIPSSPLTAE